MFPFPDKTKKQLDKKRSVYTQKSNKVKGDKTDLYDVIVMYKQKGHRHGNAL